MNNLITKKVNKTTTSMDKQKRKIVRKIKSWKFKAVAILIGIILTLVLFFIAWYQVSVFYNENQVSFQTPVIIRFPVVIKKRFPKVIYKIRTMTEYELVMSQPHGDILWKIYQLESQRGLTDNCRLTNKGFAGFGVMYNKEVICYDSFQKAVERAEYWLTSLGVDRDLATALCTWNTGRKEINCLYWQKFITL